MNMQRDLQDGTDQSTTLPALEIPHDYTKYDYIELDFHLTLNGWVMGDIRCMVGDVNLTKPAPVDRVLTLTHRTDHVSDASTRFRSVTVAWRGTATDGEIADLRAKFPPPFDPADE
jgi:hypothetical protein